MSNALLYITDGTKTTNLISSGFGFHLEDWTPAIPEPKGGGVWASPPTLSGRRMLFRNMDNYIDTFTLKVNGNTQNSVIQSTQELRRLLEKAVYYWTSDWANEPVWITARGSNETNTRYAVIMDYRTPNDDNPFSTPFYDCGESLIDDFALTIEHGPWLDNKPDENDCLTITSAQAAYRAHWNTYVAKNDAFVNVSTTSIDTASNFLRFGDMAGENHHSGIIFKNVIIPTGAIVTSAHLVFMGSANLAGIIANVNIKGEKNDSPLDFTTYANFMARARTTATISYPTLPAFLVTGTYWSPDIRTIIEEIRSGTTWSSNGSLCFFVEDNASSNNAYREVYSAETAGVPAQSPVLLAIDYILLDTSVGGEDDCDGIGNVFSANLHTTSQITHVYSYDASLGGFGVNLLSAVPPLASYKLFDGGGFFPDIEVGDLLYIGIQSSSPVASSWFQSIAFDLTIVGLTYSGEWQYYNTSTGLWTAIVDIVDNTNQLRVLGINTISFPVQADWGPTTINNTDAYWVRFEVTAAAVAATAPWQSTSPNIYTVVRPAVDVVEQSVGGDIPATITLKLTNVSADSAHTLNDIERVIASTRSLSRGSDFTPYINMSEYHNNAQIKVTTNGGTCNLAASTDSHTGYEALYIPVVDTTEEALIDIVFGEISTQYYGVYRCMARVIHSKPVSGGIGLRVGYEVNSTVFAKNDFVYPDVHSTKYEVIDLGVVNLIPAYSSASGVAEIIIRLYGSATDAAVVAASTLQIFDVIFMPIDEFSCECDARGISTVVAGVPTYAYSEDCSHERDMWIDSTLYHKSDIRSFVQNNSFASTNVGDMAGVWYTRSNGPAILQSNSNQRIWFFFGDYDANDVWRSKAEILIHVNGYKVQRYLSMRGAR